MDGSAVFSQCRRYRYVLRRTWEPRGRAVLFVGLNPSTADAASDDPTIRRCIRFARDWGYGSLLMANIFAFRSTLPQRLRATQDPIGPKNDWWLARLQTQADMIIAAWGIHGAFLDRGNAVLGKLNQPHCLGITQKGHPKHPLYLAARIKPCRFAK